MMEPCHNLSALDLLWIVRLVLKQVNMIYELQIVRFVELKQASMSYKT